MSSWRLIDQFETAFREQIRHFRAGVSVGKFCSLAEPTVSLALDGAHLPQKKNGVGTLHFSCGLSGKPQTLAMFSEKLVEFIHVKTSGDQVPGRKAAPHVGQRIHWV